MSRKEFMEKLKVLLAQIPAGEREEALQYYNDYFDEAGPEQEAQVVRELGSPEQVARKILAEYSEDAGCDDRDLEHEVAVKKAKPEVQKTGSIWKVIAIILLCILAAPVAIPLSVAVLAVVVSLVLAVLAVAFAVVVSGVAVLIAGLLVIGVGLAKIFVTPAIGLAVAGVGFLMFALGLMLALVLLWCCIKVIPWLIRGIVGLIRYPFRKAGGDK